MPTSRGLRVVVDARMEDGVSGGVQQWVIGLAKALSGLADGTEEYLFLAEEGHEGWLAPYVGGKSRLLLQPRGLVPPSASASRLDPLRRFRGRLAGWFPVLRTVYRKTLGSRRAARWLSTGHRTIEAAGADVMHFTMQNAFTTTVPSIYQPWDLQHLHLPEFFTASERRGRENAYRAFCAQSSLVVVATNWVKADVSAQYGISPDRIAVINAPPVTEAYSPPTVEQEVDIAARLQLPARFLFYPAQTWGHKNHERLFEALAELRGRGLETPLLCSGRTTERYEVLMQYAQSLEVADQVRFLGYVDTTEIQVLYRRARALVFPSLYEGWGLPIIEAFELGLPVASSNATSLPELVGDAAVVFDPRDPAAIASAIERIWTDESLRAKLVELGRLRIRAFDWGQTARVMRAHYRKVAGLPLDSADLRLLAAPPVV
jgi:glycosyltransferase involved in cell wall biosynthesis